MQKVPAINAHNSESHKYSRATVGAKCGLEMSEEGWRGKKGHLIRCIQNNCFGIISIQMRKLWCYFLPLPLSEAPRSCHNPSPLKWAAWKQCQQATHSLRWPADSSPPFIFPPSLPLHCLPSSSPPLLFFQVSLFAVWPILPSSPSIIRRFPSCRVLTEQYTH